MQKGKIELLKKQIRRTVYSRMQKHGFRCKIYDENVIFYKSEGENR